MIKLRWKGISSFSRQGELYTLDDPQNYILILVLFTSMVDNAAFLMRCSYGDIRSSVGEVCGPDVAAKVGKVWGLDTEGELQGVWRRTGHPRLWFAMGMLTLQTIINYSECWFRT